MRYEEAQRWLERADPSIAKKRESITEQLDGMKERAADGVLTHDGAAAWYALVQEMRRLADYYERDLIRTLRAGGMTWKEVADAVQAQLSSRQAARPSGNAWSTRPGGPPTGTCAAADVPARTRSPGTTAPPSRTGAPDRIGRSSRSSPGRPCPVTVRNLR